MTMATTARFTHADYQRLPEGFPAQLIEGALVKDPSPTVCHQQVVGGLYLAFCEAVGRARALLSPMDFKIDDENVFQPDVAVFAAPLRVGLTDREIETPRLVVEVLSPSTAAYDRGVKARRYLEKGVEEVWLVDIEWRTIEIRSGAGSSAFGPGETVRSIVSERLTVDVNGLFAG
jgi:Uma2 family endonuclease